MITIDGTVIEIRGYPATPFNVDARIPAINAPIKAAVAGGREQRSMSSKRVVLDIAPMIAAATASLMGLLNIIENPNTPQKLVSNRNKIHCHKARCSGKNGIGFKPSNIARIHAVIVETVIMIKEYINLSEPERISSLARSMPLVIKGNPGMINNMEQI